jgi:hypothetical protein
LNNRNALWKSFSNCVKLGIWKITFFFQSELQRPISTHFEKKTNSERVFNELLNIQIGSGTTRTVDTSAPGQLGPRTARPADNSDRGLLGPWSRMRVQVVNFDHVNLLSVSISTYDINIKQIQSRTIKL